MATPASKSKQSLLPESTSNSPWNYQFVGGLRKVPKTPDLKQRAGSGEGALPPLPETSTVPAKILQDLSTKASFQSIDTVETISENTNYKVYRDACSSLESDHQLSRELSLTPSSVIHRPPTSSSENENYEVHGSLSPSASFSNFSIPAQYSQESLVVRPLKPRARRSNESFGYYKQRSRETLRTGSFTSISSVLSQQEAFRAIVGTGSIVTLPFPPQSRVASSSWGDSSSLHPQRALMNETPHQWSSQLSTVHSVSEGGTERNSRAWSDDNGRSSAQSRHSRHMLSLGSSALDEIDGSSESVSIASPQATLTRGLERYLENVQVIGDDDEHGDTITPMQDLRMRPSRKHLSGYLSMSTDNGRSNTMLSTASSRANSLLAQSIPTWAKLYYGSGERKYLGVHGGSSTDLSESRSNSFLTNSGSPNTDHFPMTIYSPRRRPRQVIAQRGQERASLEIRPAPMGSGAQQLDPYTRRLRTWGSMSSMWSPHLRHDRRATRRHSVWEAPSFSWSTEGNMFGRRNVQIVMFIMGFIFPFGMASSPD